MQTILTIISLIGNYFNCKKLRICFLVWIICNIGWFFVDIGAKAYSRSILDLVQTAFCFYGLINWKE